MFFPWNPVNTKQKKKVFTAIWDYIRPEFVGYIRAGWLLIVSSSSAQISMGGRLNLDEGTPTLDGGSIPPHPPYNLITEYTVYERTVFAVLMCSFKRRQCDREGKSIVFTMNMIAWSRFNLQSVQVVASLDSTLYFDYFCFVASNKHKI